VKFGIYNSAAPMHMKFKRANDNLYPMGTVVTTKENQARKLVIMKYIHTTYYCAVVGDASINNLRYKQHDLVAAPLDA
jgi:hypothetical protein